MQAAWKRGKAAKSAAQRARHEAEERGATAEEVRQVGSSAAAHVMKMPLEQFYARPIGASAA